MKTLIAALALAATGVASAAPITSFVASYGGSDYYTVTDDFDGKLLWTEAQAAAVGIGGNLVAINNAAEESWLRSKFGATERFWIGFTDQTSEGVWAWVSGDAVTYSHWNSGEPNSGGGSYEEDYAVINWLTSGHWNDLPNTGAGFGGGHRGIVEVAKVPEPAVLGLLALGLAGLGATRRRKAA